MQLAQKEPKHTHNIQEAGELIVRECITDSEKQTPTQLRMLRLRSYWLTPDTPTPRHHRNEHLQSKMMNFGVRSINEAALGAFSPFANLKRHPGAQRMRARNV